MPKPIAGFLFDLDGTLVDTEHLHYQSTLAVLAEWDLVLQPEDFAPFIGFSEIPYWTALRDKFGLSATPEFLAGRRTEEYARLLHPNSIEPLPGVLDLLDALEQAGLPAAVASAAPRGQMEAGLGAAGLAERLPVYRSGLEDVAPGRSKPKPDVYLAAAEAIDVDPAACIAIEDSGVGMRAAIAAGCFTVCVPCPSHPTHESGLAHLTLPRIDALIPHLR
ncbi:MAG: HAD family hydrolase [Planctomycetota bacterium]